MDNYHSIDENVDFDEMEQIDMSDSEDEPEILPFWNVMETEEMTNSIEMMSICQSVLSEFRFIIQPGPSMR